MDAHVWKCAQVGKLRLPVSWLLPNCGRSSYKPLGPMPQGFCEKMHGFVFIPDDHECPT